MTGGWKQSGVGRALFRAQTGWRFGGIPRLSAATERTIGISAVHRSYYSPVPDRRDLPEDYWDSISSLPGVDLRLQEALALTQTLSDAYFPEFRNRFPLRPDGSDGFFLINGGFMSGDAHMYWSLIRSSRPRRILEIGGGASSMLALEAARLVANETQRDCELTVIEPYPSRELASLGNGQLRLLVRRVQDVPLDEFEALEAGDILFIDSTHVLREGSDVQVEYLEILPRLASGVLVHVHDIALPRKYPRVYFDKGLYWNEQQLLQAFLAFNSGFSVMWPGQALMLGCEDVMNSLLPELPEERATYPGSGPCSFWMTRN